MLRLVRWKSAAAGGARLPTMSMQPSDAMQMQPNSSESLKRANAYESRAQYSAHEPIIKPNTSESLERANAYESTAQPSAYKSTAQPNSPESQPNAPRLFSSLFQTKAIGNRENNSIQSSSLNRETVLMPLREFAKRRTRRPIEEMQLTDNIHVASKPAPTPMTNADPERFAQIPTKRAMKMFAEMRLPSWLVDSLAAQNILQPTKVQQQLIETLLQPSPTGEKPRPVLVKGQTGTGKSLGYIVALLANLHNERPVRMSGDIVACFHMIVVPNAILAQQLLRWIRTLLASNPYLQSKFSTIVRLLIPECELTEINEIYPKDIAQRGFSHLLIATPTMIRNVLATGHLNLSVLKTIVVDEADALLKPLSSYATRKEQLNRLRHPVPTLSLLQEIRGTCSEHRLSQPRLLAASASLNRRVKDELQQAGLVTGAYTFITDTFRASTCPAAIRHHYRMLTDSQSIEELVQLVRGIWMERPGECGVMFVPAARSKTAMKGWLEAVDIKAHILSELPTGDQDALHRITAAGSTLLLGSDVDARGWDLPMLKYVIIVDLPLSPTHYLHMAGRVGRMGATGTVYTFVAGQHDLERITNIYSMLRVSSTPYIPSGH